MKWLTLLLVLATLTAQAWTGEISHKSHKVYGVGERIKFEFIDKSFPGEDVPRTFKVQGVRYKIIGNMETLFPKIDAAPYVSSNGNKVFLHIGKLPFSRANKTMWRRLIITLEVSYHLENEIKRKRIEIAYKVGFPGSDFELNWSSFQPET